MSSHTSSAARAQYTWDDFIALEDDDLRELIEGELVEVEVPTFSHEKCVGRLVAALTVWSDSCGGCALPSGYKVRVSSKSGVMPDVQFFRRGNEPERSYRRGAAATTE